MELFHGFFDGILLKMESGIERLYSGIESCIMILQKIGNHWTSKIRYTAGYKTKSVNIWR